MNGAAGALDRRPIITCSGELEVFSGLEDALCQALPQDAGELRRSLGRPIRSVRIGASFAPFSVESLPRNSQWDLIRQPLFHVYWTECSDLELYKSTVKDDIDKWLKELNSKGIQDWLLVVVEHYDGKRANKLIPRTTVLDKIRSDFAQKQGDRCISVINPQKLETRSADSWRGMVARIRHLLLVAYSKALGKLEDHVRHLRERRNELGWNFMQYFHLQEELAQVLEMLGINDEALIQYDELDALFSQFVANGITSECVLWLKDFQKPLDKWWGLKLGFGDLSEKPSILELRAYLFAKQANMLLLTNRVWEMASRCLPFLHTCTRELQALEVTAPPGAVNCWLFLASMEVLQTCDKFNHADEVEAYSLHTASLWEYASQKLRQLGELCGLLPDGTPNSEQLHLVVGLSAGMGDNAGTPTRPSPTDKLKQALCSQDAFNKTYLELAELAMGTFKHIGRLRSARLVGREVASFYMLLGQTQKAAAFLTDILRTFQQDNWHELSAHTQIELAECFKKAGDLKKLVCASAAIASALEIDTLIRWTYFDEMRKCLDLLQEKVVLPFEDLLKINSIRTTNDLILLNFNDLIIEVVLESNFPREIVGKTVVVTLEDDEKQDKYSTGNRLNGRDLVDANPSLQRLKMMRNLDYKQDKQLSSAGVVAKFTETRRKDSRGAAPNNAPECTTNRSVAGRSPVLLTPGTNSIKLTRQANQIGTGRFCLGQIIVEFNQLTLVSKVLKPRILVQVQEEGPSLRLYKRNNAPLIAGIEQSMNLIITCGSNQLNSKDTIKLVASAGLKIQTKFNEELEEVLEVEVGERTPFTSTKSTLRVLADLLTKDHEISISCPWTLKPLVVPLSFNPPLTTSFRLHTVQHRKFLQISVCGQCEALVVSKPQVLIDGDDSWVGSKNNCDSSQLLENGLTNSYMWELMPGPDPGSTKKVEFSLEYKLAGLPEGQERTYKNFFELNNYQTHFVLDAFVEPAKGSEFCRMRAVCLLNVTIEKVESPAKSVMFEVLAEPSVWAVCGRTAGVVSFEIDQEPQTVVLEVMPLISGHLPLPLVRISKYIPAEIGEKGKMDGNPRLEPFSPGQVYNKSKGKQLHVITTANDG